MATRRAAVPRLPIEQLAAMQCDYLDTSPAAQGELAERGETDFHQR